MIKKTEPKQLGKKGPMQARRYAGAILTAHKEREPGAQWVDYTTFWNALENLEAHSSALGGGSEHEKARAQTAGRLQAVIHEKLGHGQNHMLGRQVQIVDENQKVFKEPGYIVDKVGDLYTVFWPTLKVGNVGSYKFEDILSGAPKGAKAKFASKKNLVQY